MIGFPWQNLFANAPQYSVIHTLPFLLLVTMNVNFHPYYTDLRSKLPLSSVCTILHISKEFVAFPII